MSTDNATKPVAKEPEERGVLVNDPEIKAMAMADRILATIDPRTAVRVAEYLRDKYIRVAYPQATVACQPSKGYAE